MKLILILLILLIACGQTTQPTMQKPELKPLTEGPKPTGLTTTSDGQILAYQLYKAQPGSTGVILLHMLRRTRTDWQSIAEWLQKNGYTVIAPDLRGHGQSTGKWEEYTAQDFNSMTTDVAAMKSILENEGVQKFAIIGASIGANIAYNYAITDKDVSTIILLSPGLDYRGIQLTGTMNKPFLAVASKDDQYSAQTAQELAKNSQARIKMYDDAGHGTNMFIKNDLAPTILDWLREYNYK